MKEILCPNCNVVLKEEDVSPNNKYYGGPEGVGTPFFCPECGRGGWVHYSLVYEGIELDELDPDEEEWEEEKENEEV